MRIRNSLILILCCCLIMTGIVFAQELWMAQEVKFKVFLEGVEKKFNNPIVTIDDKTYVSLRELSENLSLNVEWDEKTSSIYLKQDDSVQMYPFEDENYMWGYKDKDGKIIIEAQYYRAEGFKEGLALVRKSRGQNGNYGFIDETGQEVIPCKYYIAYGFSDDAALVSFATHTDEGKFGYIDKQGNLLFEKTFDIARSFHEGYAVVLKEGPAIPVPKERTVKKQWTYIDKSGEFATDMQFDEAYDFNNGYASVVFNGQKGRIDKKFNFYPEENE